MWPDAAAIVGLGSARLQRGDLHSLSVRESRLVFGDGKPRLRFDPDPRTYAPSASPPSLVVKDAEKRRKRTVRNLETDERKAAEKAADPWYALPPFDERDVLAVQLLMIRF